MVYPQSECRILVLSLMEYKASVAINHSEEIHPPWLLQSRTQHMLRSPQNNLTDHSIYCSFNKIPAQQKTLTVIILMTNLLVQRVISEVTHTSKPI